MTTSAHPDMLAQALNYSSYLRDVVLVQIAWLWLRHQPDSALSLWFKARMTQSTGRQKKVAIVALARKLLVALWKYVHAGVVIEGAVLTA
jgi:transposase